MPDIVEAGRKVNRRLLGVQQISGDPIDASRALSRVADPVTTPVGTRIPGLRLGDGRAPALCQALLTSSFIVYGFTHHDLRDAIAQLLGKDPSSFTAEMISYDLRRLRLHGLIERVHGTHRYQVTDDGIRNGMFWVKLHYRLIPTALSGFVDEVQPPELARLHKRLDKRLQDACAQSRINLAA